MELNMPYERELEIKFEKDYPKLQDIEHATLMQVFCIEFRKLSKPFLDFDTLQADGCRYEFKYIAPTDVVLVLMFTDTETKRTFLTVRRYDKSKLWFYTRSVGRTFKISRGV